MHLGNLYLNLNKKLRSSISAQDVAVFLDKAQSKFHNAIKMVQEQDAAHRQNQNVISIHSHAKLKRNLLLLEGRALSNLAITLIEKAEITKK